MSSPSDVATAFFAALHDTRWNDAVTLVDEQSVVGFHAREVASLLSQAQLRAEFRRVRHEGGGGVGYSPDPGTNAMLLEELGEMPVLGIEGVRTIADYAALAPADLLARYLEAGNGPRWRFAPSTLTRVKKQMESQPDTNRSESFLQRGTRRRKVIGEVVETVGFDKIAHVVYREVRSEAARVEGSEDADPLWVEILHLRDRDGWRITLGRGRDHVLFGPPWFELDFDWEPKGEPSRTRQDHPE